MTWSIEDQSEFRYTDIEDAPPKHRLIARFAANNAPHEFLARLCQYTVEWVDQVLKHKPIKEHIEHLQKVKLEEFYTVVGTVEDLMPIVVERCYEIAKEGKDRDVINLFKLLLEHDPGKRFPKYDQQMQRTEVHIYGDTQLEELRQRFGRLSAVDAQYELTRPKQIGVSNVHGSPGEARNDGDAEPVLTAQAAGAGKEEVLAATDPFSEPDFLRQLRALNPDG